MLQNPLLPALENQVELWPFRAVLSENFWVVNSVSTFVQIVANDQ